MRETVPKQNVVVKGCTIILGLGLLCLLTTAVAVVLHIQAWNQMGERLGVDPNATGLDDYLRAHIKPGMSREDVYDELNKITPMKAPPFQAGKSKVCEQVWFSIGLISGPLTPHYRMCFDSEERLLFITISS